MDADVRGEIFSDGSVGIATILSAPICSPPESRGCGSTAGSSATRLHSRPFAVRSAFMRDPQSANSEIRIGIMGSGWMGTVHAECYSRIRGAKVVGIFSRNQERAEAVAKTCDAKAVVDPSALLDDPKVDAIVERPRL
jgi:Oxidoreductase family, NAD-binding Rossmann fold